MSYLASLWDAKLKQRGVAVAIACGLLLVLPSCGIPSLRNPKPGPGALASYDLRKADPGSDLPPVFEAADSSENSAALRVEEFFSDAKLVDLMRQSVGGNQELRILTENVQIASNEIISRKGAYLPSLSPGGGIGIDKTSLFTLDGVTIRDDPFAVGRFLPDPIPNFILAPLFFWTPDIWWQLHNARDAAVMRYYAAAENRNFFVTRLIADVANNYYLLMALDQRIEILDQTIEIMEQSLEMAKTVKEGARGTELPVQRFLAEVRRNQSEKQIVRQDIVEAENRINYFLGRNPQRVERMTGDFIDLELHALSVGVPAELLRNRPDIRQAERELTAAGLDVKVARKRFYPQGFINATVGYQAFNPGYLFITPESLIAGAAGNLLVPFINRKAIKADYLTADARQLQAVYTYQRVVLNAFVELVNRLAKVENYRSSIAIKRQQLAALEESVRVAMQLFQFARADYVDVLFAQRDLRDARTVLVETKQQELAAVIETYQALGGGNYLFPIPVPRPMQPFWERFRTHKTPALQVPPVPIGEPPTPSAPLPPMSPAAEPFTNPLGQPPGDQIPAPPPATPMDGDLPAPLGGMEEKPPASSPTDRITIPPPSPPSTDRISIPPPSPPADALPDPLPERN
ncbi:TolC family protein [Planctomyces sp. SH-PL62]|uniref:TolC family protein n=1 Tax=Planctomyces sp. SH-PL62 TaxID=1636152 RepID=UPI00078CA748|nr:TolC family protein [Planctomyces sp. SH-PL62]AMV37135.1 Toluene efflux pump outer membrane protein TtgI precursor [Planctomyces sp. SH-PL62]